MARRTRQRGSFKAGAHAIADWSYRSADIVSLWGQQLPNKLGRLLRREQTRLRPLEIPEADPTYFYDGIVFAALDAFNNPGKNPTITDLPPVEE